MARSRTKPVIRLVHVTGLQGITEMLQALPEEMRSNIIAAGVKRGALPMEIAAKRFAKRSERTGWLRKSITTIVRKYPDSGTAVAIVGPVVEGWRRGVSGTGENYIKKTKASKGVTSPAVRYAHLVEFGHNVAKGGSLRPKYTRVLTTVVNPNNGKKVRRWRRGVVSEEAKGSVAGWVPAKPFLRPAFMTTQGQVLSELYEGVKDGLEKTRSKLIKSGAHAA